VPRLHVPQAHRGIGATGRQGPPIARERKVQNLIRMFPKSAHFPPRGDIPDPDGSIPNDNPFAGSPVYSLGHRNPQGLAWHPGTHTMYEAEHGPSGDLGLCCRDEVNVIEAGKNYGWPEASGKGGAPRFVDPIADSGTNDTWAPSGILVPSSGPWRGSLLVAALRGSQLRRLLLAGPGFTQVSSQEVYFRGDFGRLRDIFQGPDGTLYLLTNNTDGRGAPRPHDDQLLKIVFK